MVGRAAIILFILLVATPAPAEEPPAASAGEKPVELPTVVVSAQKREENVQEVPMSITVLSGQTLEDASIEETKDIGRLSPNVYVMDAGSYQQTSIRGVSGFVNALQSAVGYYVDDVNLPLVYNQNPELFDIERIEVLKGPQGTLYGRNSEAGVINIVTRQPDNTFRGKFYAEGTLYDTPHGASPGYSFGTNLSGPLIKDKLALGVALKWNDDHSFMKNEFNNDNEATQVQRLNGRMHLRLTPTERWDISFIADGMHSDDNSGYSRYKDGPYSTQRERIDWDSPYFRNQSEDGEALRMQYQGDAFNFVSITGRRAFYDDWAVDGDMTALPLYEIGMRTDDELWSQEFRLTSPKEHGPFEWLVGLYGYKQKTHISGVKDALTSPFGPMTNTLTTQIDSHGYAVFGEGTYTFFDRLHLTAGLRYDYNKSEGKQDNEMDMAAFPPPFNHTLSKYGDKNSDNELLPKFSVSFDFTDNIMGYATVSKGYLTGGYDYSSATSSDNFTYGPEYTWNYELGAKTNWFDNKLLLNAAIFYIDMTDKQVAEVDPSGLTAGISNAAKARSIGAEVELSVRPLQGLDISGGFGYTDTKIKNWDSFDNTGTPYDYSGNELTNAPQYTYNLGVQYYHDSGVYGRVDLLGTGPFYHDAKNELKEDAYELVNVKLGYEFDNFNVSFWCKNVFDTHYETVRYAMDGFGVGVFDGASRQFGTTVAYSF